MNDNEVMERLINDTQELGLEGELNEFLNDNPDLTAMEIDAQFRNEWDI